MIPTVEVHNRHGRLSLALTALGALTLTFAAVSPAAAQDDPLTIALYAPSVYFTDSVARAGFINDLAGQIAGATGATVQGVNLSSASDLDSADFAIVDGIYYAENDSGRAVGAAEGASGRSAPLALIVGSSGPSRLADLRGGDLILPRVGDGLVDFLTSEVLHNEITADEFFGTIDYTSNIESALAAVSSGRADATVGFAGYGDRSGLSRLGEYGDAPMPVVIQLNNGLDSAVADPIVDAIRAANGQGEIRGFGGFDDGAVASFRSRSRSSRSELTPLMTRARTITVDPGDVELADVTPPLVVGRPLDLLVIPEPSEP